MQVMRTALRLLLSFFRKRDKEGSQKSRKTVRETTIHDAKTEVFLQLVPFVELILLRTSTDG
jgi:hypothetical protein